MKEEIPGLLGEAHEGLAGGHMGIDATTRKILLADPILWYGSGGQLSRCKRLGCRV